MTTISTRSLAGTAAVAAAALFAASPALAGTEVASAAGPLVRYSAAVPDGATAAVQSVAGAGGRTIVTLHVSGLAPHTEYGAHAHVNACGAGGTAAGPHYQRVVDPVSPSVNPVYANPGNEIWLDLTTNAAGEGHARTVVDWQFPPDRRPKSVIIHAEHTHTGPTDSGTAGSRLGCLTVAF